MQLKVHPFLLQIAWHLHFISLLKCDFLALETDIIKFSVMFIQDETS